MRVTKTENKRITNVTTSKQQTSNKRATSEQQHLKNIRI